MERRKAQKGSEEELFLLRFDLTITYHTQLSKEEPGITTKVTGIRKHRALLEEERQRGSLTALLQVSRRSTRLTGAAQENDSPKTSYKQCNRIS